MADLDDTQRRTGVRAPRRAAALDFCRAAERLDLDDQGWLRGVTNAALPLLPRSDDYAAALVTCDPASGVWRYGTRIEHTELDIVDDEMADAELTAGERAKAASVRGLVSVAEQARAHPRLESAMRARGIVDLMCVVGASPGGLVGIYLHTEQLGWISRQQRAFWRTLATHLTSTAQLRASVRGLDLEAPDAVFDPDGGCAHASSAVDQDALARLRAHVLRREQMRVRDVDANELVGSWTAASREGWTVVDHFDTDGRRWVLVWENPLGEHDPRRLCNREEQLLARVLSGWTNRDAADELGLSYACASRMLQAALMKLGIDDLALLSRWRTLDAAGRLLTLPLDVEGLYAIGIPAGTAELVDRLTPSEREVVRGVLAGQTDREIGRARGTSPRTVANQLRAVFDKLGVGTRRELVLSIGARLPGD